MHDGVEHHPVLKHDRNGLGEADEQRRAGHLAESVHKGLAGTTDSQPGDEPGSDTHDQEQRRQLVESPAEDVEPDRQHHECCHNEQENEIQPRAVSPLLGLDGEFLRTGPDPPGVAAGSPDPERDGDGEKDEPEHAARTRWQLGQLLGDEHLERVDRAERGAYRCCAHRHRTGGERIESQRAHQQQEQGHKGDDLFLHVLERAASGKGNAGDGHHQELATLERPHQPPHRTAKRTGLLDDCERPTHEEHQRDDVGGGGDGAGDGDDGAEWAHRLRLDSLIGARDDDVAAGCLVVTALVAAGGQEPGSDRREQDTADQQGDRMRHTQANHAVKVCGS